MCGRYTALTRCYFRSHTAGHFHFHSSNMMALLTPKRTTRWRRMNKDDALTRLLVSCSPRGRPEESPVRCAHLSFPSRIAKTNEGGRRRLRRRRRPGRWVIVVIALLHIPQASKALSSSVAFASFGHKRCRSGHNLRYSSPLRRATATLPQPQPQPQGTRRQQQRSSTGLDLFPASALPLVDAGDKWGNWVVLLGCAAASQVLGTTTQLGRLLGPPVSAMALAFGLASIGIITPGGTFAGKEMQLLALQLATPLILLGASSNLNREAARQCGPLLVSFLLASAATVAACIVGWTIAGSSLVAALGRDGLVIAAALLAKNIGGGINYIAVCNSLQASPTAIAAGLCVDNIFALVYFPATSALAAGRPDVDDLDTTRTSKESSLTDSSVTVQGVSNALFLSASLLWISERLQGGLPLCTLLTLLVAGVAPRSWLQKLQPSAECLGTVALYVFFATAGAPGLAVADSVKSAMVPLSVFLACLYSVHGLILFLSHKLWFAKHQEPSLVPQRLLVASSAAIGGPATAVALAQAANWESLKLPSLIVGNIGYAIATFCGLIYFSLLR